MAEAMGLANADIYLPARLTSAGEQFAVGNSGSLTPTPAPSLKLRDSDAKAQGGGRETCGFFSSGGCKLPGGIAAISKPRPLLPTPLFHKKGLDKLTMPLLALAAVTCSGPNREAACKTTNPWLCGGLYSTCLGPSAPVCALARSPPLRTLCWYVSVFGFS